jgi:hypothetical protein
MEVTEERWHDMKELSERWGCGRQAVIRRLRLAEVKPVQIGSAYHVRTSQLREAEAKLGYEGMYG